MTYSEAAFEQIGLLLQTDPSNAQAYYLQGMMNFNYVQPKKTEALTGFFKAVELKPDYVEAYYWLARTKSITLYKPENGIDYRQDAINSYTRAIELDPNFRDAYFFRADEYKDFHKLDEAIVDYTSYLGLVPDDEDAMNLRAGLYYDQKDYCKAGADYKRLKDLYYGHRGWNSYDHMYDECKGLCKEGIKEVQKPHAELRQKYMGTYYVDGKDEYMLVQENDQAVQQIGMITTKAGYWSIADDGCLMISNQDKSLADHFMLVGVTLVKDPSFNNNYGMDNKYITAAEYNRIIKQNKTKSKDKKIDIFDIFKK